MDREAPFLTLVHDSSPSFERDPVPLLTLVSTSIHPAEGPDPRYCRRVDLEMVTPLVANALRRAEEEIRHETFALDSERLAFYAIHGGGGRENRPFAYAAYWSGSDELMGCGMYIAVDLLGRKVYEDRVW